MSIAEKLTTVAQNVSRTHEVVDAYNANVSENVTKINRRLLGNSYPEGGETLYEKAVGEGRVIGQQDVLAGFTNNYTKTVFDYAFSGSGWFGLDYEKTIKATSIIAAWQNYKGEYIPANMDCSNITIASNSAQWTCRWASKLKYFPDIKIPVVPRYGGTWQGCTSLERIEAVRCDENTVFDAAFTDCSHLKYVGFLGVIGQDLNMGTCSWLSKDGFIKVFECLSDTASGKTATFKTIAVMSNIGSPYEQEWLDLVATKPNWTISLV